MPHQAGVEPGIFIGYDAEQQAWEVYISCAGSFGVNILIRSTDPISDLDTINVTSSDGAVSDKLFLVRDQKLKDVTTPAGLESPTASESVVAADFDNDMDIDLYLVRSSLVMNQSNVLYENTGTGIVAVPEAGGAAGSSAGKGESVVAADYDRDGFVDLFVTNGKGGAPFNIGPHQLFRNVGNDNHWLEIDLEGVLSNRDGIGTKVLATAGGITQMREQAGGMHKYSQNHQRIHFGLGNHTMVDQLTIIWPSGIIQELTNISADQILLIIEQAGLIPEPDPDPSAIPEPGMLLLLGSGLVGILALRRRLRR
jgi:hypothetical protein